MRLSGRWKHVRPNIDKQVEHSPEHLEVELVGQLRYVELVSVIRHLGGERLATRIHLVGVVCGGGLVVGEDLCG